MGTKGLLYDREWILVSDTGVTIGQKREPRICLLCPEINLHTRKLILSFPGASPFELPLDQEQDFDAVASFCTNKVCGDRVNTFDCGDAVSDWLSDVFHTPGIRLLRQQSDDTRRSKLKDKTADGQAGSEEEKPRLSMANESQLLVLSRASVRELQNKMADVVDMDDAQDTRLPTAPANIGEDNLIMRFRGNLVIDGGKAFEEDTWASVSVGDNTMLCHGPCSRCQMICMDQQTAQKSREPLRTLSVWRGKKVPFGVYSRLIPRSDGSKQVIRVGDLVTV
ncbi:molybdenum cofactor sulfurase [Aplysia californica]|uniref:Molybdenum cofactor sulfurase n=1 Tax=Aplysia californica TaxID=6500 RepID=A0ABM0KAG9_APLCA|nr:molybdenum cofactor sulfurase [Aplysia californica]